MQIEKETITQLLALRSEIEVALAALVAEKCATEAMKGRLEAEARDLQRQRPHPDDGTALRAYIEAEGHLRAVRLWSSDEWSRERSQPLEGRLGSGLTILRNRLQDLEVDTSALAFVMPATIDQTARRALALIDDLATKASAERLTEEEWRQRESKRRTA